MNSKLGRKYKMDTTKIQTRPELNLETRIISPGMPGSFVFMNGKHVANLNDEAMKARSAAEEPKTETVKKLDVIDKEDSETA